MNNLEKVNLVSRYGLAFVFFYHGLAPKIIRLRSGELLISAFYPVTTNIPSLILCYLVYLSQS